MKISDLLGNIKTISLEFFPPKAAEGIPGVFRVIERLKVFHPDFVSVTYGAGGTNRAFSEEITLRIQKETDLEVMAHVTCSRQTRDAVHGLLDRLCRSGVGNVIALRGDPPRGHREFVPADGGFAHATDLIEHIKQNFGLGVAAACYPEGHPESPDLTKDLEYTKLKVQKGADFLITQLFYDNSVFFDYVDRARRAGIENPIIPGVLPILSTSQIRRFTTLCGAKIPAALDRELERFAEDDEAVRELGVEYATRQVSELWDAGVPGIHFYVLNRSYSVSKILTNLGLDRHVPGV